MLKINENDTNTSKTNRNDTLHRARTHTQNHEPVLYLQVKSTAN